jgi:adenylate kinase family enzyme
METVEKFKEQQEQTISVLKQLLGFLQDGEQFGVKIDPKFKSKLETGIKTTEADKLKVVLIGGFSEGKTSIAAAWAEKYDKSSMKISQQESSNEVAFYSLEDFDLIDTPGLFGFKETADKEKYKDITNKYVSEAHLVLYVMNPNNPIKESHKEELVWLFKDLNLLPRTVFVLSRFDEEVDIEDNEDYRKGLEIKKNNIIGRLKDFGIIKDDNISIVAVSVNPFDKGVEYWLSRPDDYKRLSRIETLQKATTEKIESTGSAFSLVEASKKSIVNDLLKKELPLAIECDEKISRECMRFTQMCNDVQKNLAKTQHEITRVIISLREFIVNLFTDLIVQAKGADEETIGEFWQRSIGDEGIVLNTKIQNEFERQLGSTNREISKMKMNVNAEIQQYNNVIGTIIGDMALKGIKASGSILANGSVQITNVGIKAARDVLIPAFKFKPWQAVKLASNINKALPIIGQAIGIAIEIGDSISRKIKEEQFKSIVDGIVRGFEKQRKEMLEFIDDENGFISQFFPDYITLLKQVDDMLHELQEKEKLHERFQKWREQGETIEAEFSVLSRSAMAY